jgi:hypothetical protein
MALDGTQKGSIAQATPVHVECMLDNGWVYNKERSLIYRFV